MPFVYKPNTPQARYWSELPRRFVVDGVSQPLRAVHAAGNLDLVAFDLWEATIIDPPFDPLSEDLQDGVWITDAGTRTATMTRQVVNVDSDTRNLRIDEEAQKRVDALSGDQRTKTLKLMKAVREQERGRRGGQPDTALLDALVAEADTVLAIYSHAADLKADPQLPYAWPA